MRQGSEDGSRVQRAAEEGRIAIAGSRKAGFREEEEASP